MGFLHENITFSYFVFLVEWSSALSLSVGFFRTFGLARYLWSFSVGQSRHTSQLSNILVAFKRPNIGRKHFLAFFFDYERHTLQQSLPQNHGIGLCQKHFVQSGLILKTVATFVKNEDLIWQQGGFFFDYSVHKRDCWLKIVSRWDKHDNIVLCAEKKKSDLKLLAMETKVATRAC